MIDYEGAITVETQGHSGSLALMCRNKEDITLSSFSENHVDVTLELNGCN